MANEVIEIPVQREGGSSLPVTQDDVERLQRQRELLKGFIVSQLVEGIDNDYAVIPGTKKKSLLKPGAEKIARLFGLGIRMRQVDKELDRKDNFAMFTYRAEVYPVRQPEVVIAECEASCNSQEKKYKERTTWEGGQKRSETTPVCDILNTLQKMAQKRAMVGAVILAVAGADFLSQDIDDEEDAKTLGVQRPEPNRAQAAVPKATASASQNQANAQTAPTGTIPTCERCGTQMRLSRNGDAYTCPNWRDQSKGDHSYVKV